MTKILRSKKGENYIDVAVSVMVIAFVLIFMINIVSVIALNQKLKMAADQIIEYTAMNGSTDISAYINTQRKKVGVDFDYNFDGSETISGTNRVQLGDSIVCTLTYDINFLGFGNVIHLMTATASSSGLSRVYWK